MLGALGRIASFDIAIIREMYRTGEVTIAGVDPRLNVSQIAERLGCSRAKVTARLEDWRQSGFLTRYDVWPNPALFGLRGATVELRLGDRLEKPRVLERLALLDGAVGAIDFLGPWLSFQFLFPDDATRDRRAKLLKHVEGVAEVGGLVEWAGIPAERKFTPLDLRILRALRDAPTASLQEIAKAAGVSTRTVTTRYGALVAGWEVWFLPVFDFTKLPGPVVGLNVELDTAGRAEEVRRRLRRSYPDSLQFGWGGFGPIEDTGVTVFFVYLHSAAAIEELERTVRGWEGVTAVEANVLVRIHAFGEAFDELLRAVRPPPPAAPPRRGRGPAAPSA